MKEEMTICYDCAHDKEKGFVVDRDRKLSHWDFYLDTCDACGNSPDGENPKFQFGIYYEAYKAS